jgi:hypothetical protein
VLRATSREGQYRDLMRAVRGFDEPDNVVESPGVECRDTGQINPSRIA